MPCSDSLAQVEADRKLADQRHDTVVALLCGVLRGHPQVKVWADRWLQEHNRLDHIREAGHDRWSALYSAQVERYNDVLDAIHAQMHRR